MNKILMQISECGIKDPARGRKPKRRYGSCRSRMREEMRRVLGRALAIRHASRESCKACELEIHATAIVLHLKGWG